MATEGTDRQSLRVYPELWEEFGKYAEPDRSTQLREYMKRVIRAKGGTVPPEPERKRRPKPVDNGDSH